MSDFSSYLNQYSFLEQMIKDDSFIQVEEVNKGIRWLPDMEYEDRGGNCVWNSCNGKFYYHKYPKALNEFIGEMIAKRIKLDTAHYEPVYFKGSLMLRTPDFRNYSYKYIYLTDIFYNDYCSSIETLRKKLNLTEKDVDDVLKMIALDLFMRQTDRCGVNIMVKQNKEYLDYSLAPIYDYSNAFPSSFKKYGSDIVDLKMTKEDVSKKMEKYPKFYDYLKRMLEISMLEMLKEFCLKYNLELTDEVKNFYLLEEEKSKEMITSIM